MIDILNKIDKSIAAKLWRKNLILEREYGVVSFSFDDAPKSACDVGRRTLENHDCRGTWYIAGGLTDRLEQGRMCHSINDIQDLAESGHQIGCHTFSHRPCNTLKADDISSEIERNALFFKSIDLPSSSLHFSFPLGEFNCSSKKIASKNFVSSRITGGGLQVGYADLNALRAERLYQHVMTQERLSALIKATALQRGWLIFYTHDVDDSPSQWGCSKNLLDSAIQTALSAGCKVMPVDEAIRYWDRNNIN